jgi:hypothetical protein
MGEQIMLTGNPLMEAFGRRIYQSQINVFIRTDRVRESAHLVHREHRRTDQHPMDHPPGQSGLSQAGTPLSPRELR